jgi:hypothetical protein
MKPTTKDTIRKGSPTRAVWGTLGAISASENFKTTRIGGEPRERRDSEDGVETVEIRRTGGGGGALAGVEIIWADQTSSFILATDILGNYDSEVNSHWSVVIPVVAGVFDKENITYDGTADIFEDDGATPPVQTNYRLRVVTQYTNANNEFVSTSISLYGQYREVTICINGEPIQSLVKIA